MTQQKKDLQRVHEVTCDYGIRDYYNDFSKKSTDIDYTKYKEVVESLFSKIRDKMSSAMYDFKIPHGLGRILVRKYIPKVKIDENGEPSIRLAPDWVATKKMWNEYPETKERKQLVYHTNDHSAGYLFTIDYKKENSKILNRVFYGARINRTLKRDVAKNIINGSFDALSSTKQPYVQ